jgi:N-acetylmuramoyl-L-alanine amidase
MEQSVELARLVQSQFKNHAGRRTRGTGVYQAGFLVLRKTSAPSILTELGFISHPGEEAFLASEEGVNAMSQSLYNAFIKYRKTQNVAYQAPAPVVKEVKPEPQSPNLRAQISAPQSQTPSVRPVDTAPKHEQNNASNATSVEQGTVENATATTCDNATAVSAAPAVDPGRPIFKLQITVMSKKISTDDPMFRGLEGVECYEDGGVFKYTCYPSNDFDTVRQQQAKVKEKFPQVFVVAFMDGKRADLYQAKQQALKKK